MFLEQIGCLEKENAALTQELEEKREMDEFKSLEEEFRKEHEVKIVDRRDMYFFVCLGFFVIFICCFYLVCVCRMRCKLKLLA